MRAVVLHYHEVGLKGRNRGSFEDALARNATGVVGDLGEIRFRRLPGRLVAPLPDEVDLALLRERLGRVFGIQYFAIARAVPAEPEAITAAAIEELTAAAFDGFAVRGRVAHAEGFPWSARLINENVGAALVETTGATVNLSNPGRTVWIEVVGEQAYVFADRDPGAGGLPVGVSGKVVSLLSAGIDSPVATARLMRRGATIELVHFHSQPYTDASSVRVVTEVAEHLNAFQRRLRLWIVPMGEAQREMSLACPEGLRTLLYRRHMVRVASLIAAKIEAGAIVTGDSLGQVASQTLENLAAVEDASTVPVLRPLVGMDKLEIIDESRHLGLEEVSNAPCQEACVLFEPKRPRTRASAAELRRAEELVDVAALAAASVEQAETRSFRFPYQR